jgi:hypothetical protein
MLLESTATVFAVDGSAGAVQDDNSSGIEVTVEDNENSDAVTQQAPGQETGNEEQEQQPVSDNEENQPSSDNEEQQPVSGNEEKQPASDDEGQQPVSDNEENQPSSDNEEKAEGGSEVQPENPVTEPEIVVTAGDTQETVKPEPEGSDAENIEPSIVLNDGSVSINGYDSVYFALNTDQMTDKDSFKVSLGGIPQDANYDSRLNGTLKKSDTGIYKIENLGYSP